MGNSDRSTIGQTLVEQRIIVLLVPGFPASEAETDCLPPLQNFVKALVYRYPDIAIHVVSFHYPFERKNYIWNGATVHALNGRNKRFPSRFWTWLKAGWCVLRLRKSYRMVAVHSHWLSECTYVGAWVTRLTGTRHVATIRGQDALAGNPYLGRLPFDRMTVTACSENAAGAFHTNTGRRVDYVVPTGLDAEGLESHEEPAKRHIDLLGVGSLSPVKDFALFLKVVAEVARDYPNLKSMIVGDGPERQTLECRISEGRLQPIVTLAGHLPREDVLDLMRRARILLHTASYEGQGYVFLEALASGMHIVCRNVGHTGSSNRVHRCSSTEDIVSVIKSLLALELAHTNVEVCSVHSTVEAFERVYGLD